MKKNYNNQIHKKSIHTLKNYKSYKKFCDKFELFCNETFDSSNLGIFRDLINILNI